MTEKKILESFFADYPNLIPYKNLFNYKKIKCLVIRKEYNILLNRFSKTKTRTEIVNILAEKYNMSKDSFINHLYNKQAKILS